MSIYIVGVIKMNKETVKTIVIILLSAIFVSHSIEKKNIIDELTENNSFLKYKIELADSLVFDTTQHGLKLALTLATYERKIEEYENNKHKVTVTMYHPVSDQTDDTPNITADGSVIRINSASEYRYVAVSRNMLIRNKGFLNFGDYIWLDAGKKSGVYQVRDVMNKRFVNRVDILETPGTVPYKYNEASLRRINVAYNDF
jgi:3D (Asp-Asp-Asp) domain-containing protein